MTSTTEISTQNVPRTEHGSVVVTPGPGRCFQIDVRGHRLVADHRQVTADLEQGPEPIEILVSGLAACVATYVASYLRRHSFDTSAMSVTASFTTGGRPVRVTDVSMVVTVPALVPRAGYAPLLAVARSCTAHNTLLDPPEIQIELKS